MKTNHTPGPWKVLTKIGYDKSFCVRVCVDDEHTVTWLDFWTDRHCTSQKAQETQLSNAYLIAAAPDLLNMLQRMVDETAGDGHTPCALTKEQARAAIARATEAESEAA